MTPTECISEALAALRSARGKLTSYQPHERDSQHLLVLMQATYEFNRACGLPACKHERGPAVDLCEDIVLNLDQALRGPVLFDPPIEPGTEVEMLNAAQAMLLSIGALVEAPSARSV